MNRTSHLAGLWPQFGLLVETTRLQLRDDEMPALAGAARDIADPDGMGAVESLTAYTEGNHARATTVPRRCTPAEETA